MKFSDLKENVSDKVKNINLSDLQRNWLSVLGAVVIIGSFSAITIYGPSNSRLKNQINSDASQIAKLNASDKGKTKPKAKVEVQAELPNIYKKAMQIANDVTNAQNTMAKLAIKTNYNYDTKNQDYQSAYSTLSQDVANDAHFKNTTQAWVAITNNDIMRVYPGSYDGRNEYKLLFTVAPKNNAQNVLYYITGAYHVDDNMIHDLNLYSTNAASDPKNGSRAHGDDSPVQGLTDEQLKKSLAADASSNQ